MRKMLIVLPAALVLAFSGATALAASNPTAAQYNTDPQEISAGAESAGAGSARATGLDGRVGSLPFTGVDVLALAGVAVVLTGTGVALRMLSAPRRL